MSTLLSSIAISTKRFMFPMPGLWLIACFVLQIALVDHGRDVSADMLAWVWIGLMWAGWAGWFWMASAIPNRGLWLLVVAIGGVWHSLWMSIGREQPMLRYLLMFGGYAVAQSLLFRFFQVPAWTMESIRGPLRLVAADSNRRQFAIVELLVLMTATALLITGAKRYEPPGGQSFWIGLPFVYLSLAATATFCGLTASAKSSTRRRMCAVGALATILAGSCLIAWIDNLLSSQAVFIVSWVPYFGIQGTFAVFIISLAACGIQITPTKEIKTPDPPNSDDDEFPTSNDLLPFRPLPHK